MKIACLQFSSIVGDVDNNISRADDILNRANPQDLDLMVLPELAFSGSNFTSLQHASPFLEHTTSGISSLWARYVALKLECVVTVGYPEKVDLTGRWPASPEYYNSTITFDADGEVISNYRKTFLYRRDETWALEGEGFYGDILPVLRSVVMGIGTDLSPYKLKAPWTAWEFAYHILYKQADLVIISMAWLTHQEMGEHNRRSKEPDISTLSYWVSRLEPVIGNGNREEVIVVIANRCGTEGRSIYAGTSCVLGIADGVVKVYGILGRGESGLLVVDTTHPPLYGLVTESNTMVAENVLTSHTAPKRLDSAPRIDASLVDLQEFACRTDEIIGIKKVPGPPTVPVIPVMTRADALWMLRPQSPKSRNANRTRALPTQQFVNEPAPMSMTGSEDITTRRWRTNPSTPPPRSTSTSW